MSSDTDRIEKQIVLRAPISRVWHAISDAEAFGTWFGVAFDGPFAVGARVTGKIVPTKVDADVAASQAQYTGMACDIAIEEMVTEARFAFRWLPGADPSAEDTATTLVVFTLASVPDGTRLTITETGFDAIPIERRAKAFADNEGGWAVQTSLIAKYIAHAG